MSNTHSMVETVAEGRSTPRPFMNVAFLGAACGLLLMAGCAANPTTPTPPPAPAVVAAPPPPPEMGPPAATFVFLPDVPISDMTGSDTSSSGTGTMHFKGKRYTFTAVGLTAGRMGTSPGPITGEIYNLKNLRDINGTYTAEMMTGGKEAILKNNQGVTIHVVARSGVQMALQSVTVRLNYR